MYKIKSMFVRLISSILVIIILQTSLSTLVYATENLVNNNEIQSKKVESDDKNLNLTNKENDIGKKTENFKIILQWEKISDSEFIWKAKKGEEKTVKLILTYKNESIEKTYLPEELQIIIPGIGKLNKMSTQKASTILADEYGTKELKNDWSYKYNLESDTYIFYNNKEVKKGSIFNGKIELIWDFSAKDCIDNYSQSVQASLKNEENTILSPELKMTYIYQGNTETSEKVDFTKEDINQVKKQLNATNDEQTVQEDEAKTGNIVLIKEDKIDGSKLKGIEYGLYVDKDVYDEKGEIKYKKDQLIEKAVTNELGQVTFENVPIGEYYLKEIATTYGYEISTEKYLYTINDENINDSVTKTVKGERSRASLDLLVMNNESNVLQGVEFYLYNKDGKRIVEEKKEHVEKEVNFSSTGTYEWTQNEDGTWQSGNYNVNNSSSIMESDEFYLKNSGTLSFDWSVSSESVNYDYVIYSITNVKTGAYYEETKIGGTSYGTVYDSLKFNHIEKKLDAGLYKVSFKYKKDGSTSVGLDRAFVKNAKVEYEGMTEIPYVTDENGRLRIENIAWDNYYIREKEQVQGYEKLDTKFEFIVNKETFSNGNNVVTSVINNDTKEKTSLIIYKKKLGKIMLTQYGCDAEGEKTENTLQGGKFELYKSSGEFIGEYTTNKDGKIIIENLDWGSYNLQEIEAPSGYNILDKKIEFIINSKNVNFMQELKAYNKLETGKIIINKTIKASSLEVVHGNATFIFKIVGTDTNGQEKVTLYRTVVFLNKDKENADLNGDVTKSIVISDAKSYKYEITEEKNYRYSLAEIIPKTNAEREANKGIINLTGIENIGEITFKNTKCNNSLLSDSGLITNSPQSSYYLVGIGAKPKENSYIIRTNITASDFIFTLYYSNGDKKDVELTDGITFNGKNEYTQTEEGSYITNMEYICNGKTYKIEITTNWIMPNDYYLYSVISSSEKTIEITGINSKYSSPSVLYIPNEYNGYKVTRIKGKTSSSSMSNINNIKNIIIEDGITSIGHYTFEYVANLASIEIPSSVTSIGQKAFYGCSSLASIKIPEGITEIDIDVFANCSALTNVEISNSVKSIGRNAFYNCKNLKNINIPDSVTYIGTEAFGNCYKLANIEIPNSITKIEGYVFYGCVGLTNIEIPNSVTSIGDSAFRGCINLTSIRIPDSVTKIYDSAFYGCRKLSNIVLPKKLTSIANYAFVSTGLTNIIIPEGVTSIGHHAFHSCSNLISIKLPDDVRSIGELAFYNCGSLTSIELSSSVKTIGNNTFKNCSKLTTINYHGTEEQFNAVTIGTGNDCFKNATVNYIE